MESLEEKTERIKRLCLTGEIKFAYEDAKRMHPYVVATTDLSPRVLRLVADAKEGTTKFEPTPTCLNIARAWYQAWLCAARSQSVFLNSQDAVVVGGLRVSALPTLREVTDQFDKQFGEEKRPADWTFRKTLKRLHLRLDRGKVGRPNNSLRK